jgi:hypothetical protein
MPEFLSGEVGGVQRLIKIDKISTRIKGRYFLLSVERPDSYRGNGDGAFPTKSVGIAWHFCVMHGGSNMLRTQGFQ